MSGGEARAIVLADSAHRGNDAGQAAMLAFARSAAEGYASLEDAAGALAALGLGSGGPPTPDRLRHVLRESGGRYWWPWDPAFGVFWSAEHESHADRVLTAARAARCPILLVRGTESPLVTEEIAGEFCDQVPSARRLDLPGVGHMLTGDDNAVFIDAMRPFLGEITARS
ncbi:alpha/beta hydrolase [Svornostia abyssi]|uniref:Alpha/beta hydrolase n=1 Tax=Svornostia abyssi TaxID=2898438 RepID=A0ABY5PIY0_9ACTN|nr:alpha/beta hydrolase [Parviterribacteraceae bacterium J379]